LSRVALPDHVNQFPGGSAVDSFFQWVYDLPIADQIRSSALAFPWIESVHVLAITLVVGSMIVVDLRLLGLASGKRPVTQVLNDVLPVTWVAFAVAAVTGLLLFTSNSIEYVHNKPFQFKMIMMALAGLNMLVFHFVTFRAVGSWNDAVRPPPAARFAGAFSLLCWAGVVAFGRWIGFTIGF
jgi:hypothetical protein